MVDWVGGGATLQASMEDKTYFEGSCRTLGNGLYFRQFAKPLESAMPKFEDKNLIRIEL